MASQDRIEATLSLHDYTGRSRVEAVHGREEVSRGFEYVVDFEAEELDLDALRASQAVVSLRGPHGERAICGLVAALEVLGVEANRELDLYAYRAVLRPLTHTLTLRRGFRIFQQQSSVDIVKQVFTDAGLPESAFEWRVGSYAPREYCVQYDESDYAFVCRLLEEEGIWFRFEQAEDGHVMVLQDDSANADKMEPDYLPFDFVGGMEGRLCARELTVAARARVERVSLGDCHPLRPSIDLRAQAKQAGAFAAEHYEFPSGCVDPTRQKQLAQARLDEQVGAALATRVRTNALTAMAGKQLTLDGHPTSDDGEHFVRAVSFEVVLRATEGRPRASAGAGREAVCNIDLELQPLAIPYRPERLTPRPRVVGLQTARVTGPQGQEVHFDDLGRVKLQFHWDREGKLDDTTSCWVRVAQGHTTGSLAMPRIGWEVLVEFVEGNPDRPLCLGRLYNPFFPPPAQLPAQKTVSTVRSDSVGGDGYNLLRFDDQAGAEMVELHAQYDLNTSVAHDKKLQVAKATTHGVAKNRKLSVNGNDSESYAASFSDTVSKNQKLDVGANRTTKINGNATEDTAGAYTRSVGAAETIEVGSIVSALISLLASEAISGAVSAASSAAQRLGARALGPLMPALTSAKAALGTAAKYAGPAAALLSGGNATVTALGEAAGALVSLDKATDLDTATGLAAAAASAELAPKVSAAAQAALGGGDGGGGGGAGGDGGGGGGGSGNWTTSVAGDVSETIGALVAISSAQGISQGIGGNRRETIAAARLETIKGGRVENTGEAKAETVGVYTVKAESDISIDAGAAASIQIGGALSQSIGGSHTLVGKKGAALKTKKLKLKAKSSVALVCGMAKVIIDGGGVAFSGLQKISIEGDEITLDPVSIGPG